MSERPEQRLAVERALMERARAHATRQVEKPPRRVLQHAIAAALALSVVAVVLFGFDRFLTSIQKFMELKVEEPPPAVTGPMPAYVVSETPSPTEPVAPGAGTSQAGGEPTSAVVD